MAKFSIGVTKGVAAIYPEGMKLDGPAVILHQGDPPLVFPDGPYVAPRIAPDPKDILMRDVKAPGAGVASDEPFGERDATLEVKAIEGAIKVRVYVGSDFTERNLAAGDSHQVPVTESNRLTIQVYDADPVVNPLKKE